MAGSASAAGGTTSSAGLGGTVASASGGGAGLGGVPASAGSGGTAVAGGASSAPPTVDGRSIYTLECHGDSKDCQLGTVPCFGVESSTANVAAGWACANRCTKSSDCSDADSGAEAQASCVPFTSSGHCLLVCQNENQSFACPQGMTCYAPPKSPVGYCLWQPR